MCLFGLLFLYPRRRSDGASGARYRRLQLVDYFEYVGGCRCACFLIPAAHSGKGFGWRACREARLSEGFIGWLLRPTKARCVDTLAPQAVRAGPAKVLPNRLMDHAPLNTPLIWMRFFF